MPMRAIAAGDYVMASRVVGVMHQFAVLRVVETQYADVTLVEGYFVDAPTHTHAPSIS
jgi:hypothetical protein